MYAFPFSNWLNIVYTENIYLQRGLCLCSRRFCSTILLYNAAFTQATKNFVWVSKVTAIWNNRKFSVEIAPLRLKLAYKSGSKVVTNYECRNGVLETLLNLRSVNFYYFSCEITQTTENCCICACLVHRGAPIQRIFYLPKEQGQEQPRCPADQK